MLISYQHKYIFIAVPKTGTVSTESFLLEHDNTLIQNRVIIDGKKKKVRGHATALEIKQIMGAEFDDFKKIAIVREPLSKMVSSYFFYKNGQPITSGNHNPYPIYLRIGLTKILPFSLWAMVYPYKSNLGHLADQNNNPLVDYIGRLSNLEGDLKKILKKIGLNLDNKDFPHKNKSTHTRDYSSYIKFGIQAKIIQHKIQEDKDFISKLLKKNI